MTRRERVRFQLAAVLLVLLAVAVLLALALAYFMRPVILPINGRATLGPPVCGGWQVSTGPRGLFGPPEDHISGVAVAAADDAWAVGHSGLRRGTYRTLIRHWDGTAWTDSPHPADRSGDDVLSAVSARAPDDVYAVGGSRQGPLVLHWDGAGWTHIPPITAIPADGALYAVAAPAAGEVWAAGGVPAGGGVRTLLVHGTGTTWQAVPSPDAGAIRGLAVAGPDDVWAAGNGLLHWDGRAWQAGPDLTPLLGTGALAGVAATGPDDVWVAGAERAPTPPLAHWNGREWRRVPVPPGAAAAVYLSSIAAVAPNDVWVAGAQEDESGAGRLLLLHWDGAGWQAVPLPGPLADNRFLDVAAAPGGVWTAGIAGQHEDGPYYALLGHLTRRPCPAP
jgi:hypothetical protein